MTSCDSPLDILAFSPHPDDVELGCGGTLALAVHEGLRVAIADLSEGECASRGTPVVRAREKAEAAACLGVTRRLSLGLADTRIGEAAADQDAVIAVLRETRPALVLVPSAQDRHPDHAAVSQLVTRCVFLAGVAGRGGGRPHHVGRIAYYMVHHPFEPSLVVDVSSVWAVRRRAVAAYASQFDPAAEGGRTALSDGGFLRFVEARAIYYGAMIGAAHGEPFLIQGPLAAGSVRSLLPVANRGYSIFGGAMAPESPPC